MLFTGLIFLARYLDHQEITSNSGLSIEFSFEILNSDYLDASDWRKKERVVKIKVQITDYILKRLCLNKEKMLTFAFLHSKQLLKTKLKVGVLNDFNELIIDKNEFLESGLTIFNINPRITKPFTIK